MEEVVQEGPDVGERMRVRRVLEREPREGAVERAEAPP
jgi:hypothetical protein